MSPNDWASRSPWVLVDLSFYFPQSRFQTCSLPPRPAPGQQSPTPRKKPFWFLCCRKQSSYSRCHVRVTLASDLVHFPSVVLPQQCVPHNGLRPCLLFIAENTVGQFFFLCLHDLWKAVDDCDNISWGDTTVFWDQQNESSRNYQGILSDLEETNLKSFWIWALLMRMPAIRREHWGI